MNWEPAERERPFAKRGPGIPMVAVTVHNIGRLPAVVTNVMFGSKLAMTPVSYSESEDSLWLPHKIEVSDSATWFVQAGALKWLSDASSLAKPGYQSDDVLFVVALGNGKQYSTASASAAKMLDQLTT
jgi:hypothetical protein